MVAGPSDRRQASENTPRFRAGRPRAADTLRLSPSTEVAAAVSWLRGPFRLGLSAHNLFGEEYSWNGDIACGQSADIGRPGQVMLSVSFFVR